MAGTDYTIAPPPSDTEEDLKPGPGKGKGKGCDNGKGKKKGCKKGSESADVTPGGRALAL